MDQRNNSFLDAKNAPWLGEIYCILFAWCLQQVENKLKKCFLIKTTSKIWENEFLQILFMK